MRNNIILERTESYLLVENIRQHKTFKISPEDENLLENTTWRIESGLGYVKGFYDGKDVRLHNVIMNNPPDGMIVDHNDRDRTNCCRWNLSYVTYRENNFNSEERITAKSKFHGVSFDSRRGKFIAQTIINSKKVFIGRFESEIEAAIMIDKELLVNGFREETNLLRGLYEQNYTEEFIINYKPLPPKYIRNKEVKYVGVSKHMNKYTANVFYNGKNIVLKGSRFDDPLECAKFRERWLDEHPDCKSKRNNL